MKPLGLVLVAAACLAPLIWLPGLAEGRDVIALFSQYLGMAALIAMACAQVIATRWPGVENVFGPMDKAYRLHKWLGVGALAAILLHDVIDAEMDGLGAETLLVEAAETAGELSLYGILILVVITVATFIPYSLWRWTHRLIGVFFLMGAAHYLFILKPFAVSSPLGLYVTGACAIGAVAYVYTSAWRGLRPRRGYRIAGLEQAGAALAVELTPTDGALRHRAGQFAFFSFAGAGLEEPHPFTISSAPREDGGLRLTMAPLGDFTTRALGALKQGQAVEAEGPFGRFGQGVAGPATWIAAGVGVTPFVALAEALAPDHGPIKLIYAVKEKGTAAHGALLEGLAREKPNLEVVFWESAVRGRLGADDVAGLVDGPLADAHVLFCGPVEMRRALGEGLRRRGLSQRRFHYEEFEIRTGIGLRRLLRWIWARRLEKAAQ